MENRTLFILAETLEEARDWARENDILKKYPRFTFLSHPDKLCSQIEPHYVKRPSFNKHPLKKEILIDLQERRAKEILI